MKPHKHAELIKAWADGAEIEERVSNDYKAGWFTTETPSWNKDTDYRIKPEPKPDVVVYLKKSTDWNCWIEYLPIDLDLRGKIKLTFDGETGELKSAEVLK